MLEEVKNFLRIDGDEDNILLASLILAAKIYIKNATDVVVDELNDLHKLAVNLLVAHSYEHRLPVGQEEKLAFSLESIILQLKYCYVATPANFSAYLVDGIVNLTWDENSEYDLVGYKVYQNGLEITSIITNEYKIEGLLPGTYLFQVLAYDESNNKSKLTKAISIEVV